MAWHLFSTKPLSEPMLDYCQLYSWEHISVIYNQYIFIDENQFENVVGKLVAI